MPTLRALIVDDEPLARERLRLLLREADADVRVVGEAGDGEAAADLVRTTDADVLFLDIRMPVLDGFDVLALAPAPRPHVVFVTAHEEHALDAFDAHAADYLTKPVRLARLEDALRHVARLATPPPDEAEADDGDEGGADDGAAPLVRLTVTAGRRLRVVDPADVRYFEAEDKVVLAHVTGGDTHVVDFPLKTLAARLGAVEGGPTFLRTHRSYLVNVAVVRELVPWFSGTYRLRLADGAELPVARRRVARVKRLLGGG
jgi:two-component system LytT family response regulator